ncbi:MAG: DNA repair protein RadA, partial [Chloroflexi bacterium]|nr:DNA repair protein RadA [Chloroflexota bacterium]
MARTRTRFVCQACGATQPRWMGRCPDCGEWNTMVETLVADAPAPSKPSRSTFAVADDMVGQARPIVEVPAQALGRLPVPMEELDRVLGGGIVPGSVVLVGGDPGIGKSTLLLQLAAL